MKNTDDNLLSAYVDGELAADESLKLEQRLPQDSQLQARLDAMRAADAATRKLFAEVDAAPMPDAVLQLLEREPAKPDNVVAFPERGIARFLQMPVAIAASMALAVGLLVGEVSQQFDGPATSIETLSARSIDSGSELHRLLEASSSGAATELANGESGRAVLTFADKEGRYCRQLRVDSSAGAAHAIACRGDTNWEVEALAFTDAAPEGQFQAAATDTPVTIMATVDGLIGTADPLDGEEEKQAISNSWKKGE